MTKAALLKRFEGFVKGLSKKDRVGILVHCDPDGLASGVVIAKALQKLGLEPHSIACSPYGSRELMEKKLDIFRFARCNKLIVADLSFDQDRFFLDTAEKFFEQILFLDHHKLYADQNSEKTVFIKVNMVSAVEPSQYPASKLCFDLFSSQVDLEDAAWVAVVGILGDVSGLQWKKFLDETMKRTGFSFKQLEDCKEIVEAVGLMEPYHFSDLIRLFIHAKGPQEVLDSNFARLLFELHSEMDFWMEKFKAEKEAFPGIELVWFECKPRFPIKAPLVNKISLELYPNKTVIFIQNIKDDGTVSVSARRQDGKVKMNDLLEKATAGIEGAMGGGHAPAAGGKVPSASLERFKQNVIAELEKQFSGKKPKKKG